MTLDYQSKMTGPNEHERTESLAEKEEYTQPYVVGSGPTRLAQQDLFIHWQQIMRE
jgi:hypothetical protein